MPPTSCVTTRTSPGGRSRRTPRIQDLTGPEVLYNLPRDDRHRLIDAINEERRATDRELQDHAYLTAEADVIPDDKPWWHQYLPWIGALGFLVASLVVVLFRSGG